ncbi:hypothetical protein CcaverHIS002_0400150 [Cutaneotrichosporon cavernicola]|nr:hypothetical protein CcaverHIS002_0400150 [Cutaneotrichosporon cavernicola]
MAEPSSKRARPNVPDRDDPAARGPRHPATRKRAPLACEECRVRKRRCDGAVPICGGCTKRKTTCIYLAELRERSWQQGMIQSLRSRLGELEEAERLQQQQQSNNVGDQTDSQRRRTTRRDPVLDREPTSDVEQGVSNQNAGHEASTQACNTIATQNPSLANASGMDMETWLFDDARATASPRPGSPGNNGVGALGTAQSPPLPATDVNRPGTQELPAVAHVPGSSTVWVGNVGRPSSQASPSASSHRLEAPNTQTLMSPIDRTISLVSAPIHSGLKTVSSVAGAASAVPQKCTCDRFLRTTQWTLPLRRQADDLVRLYFTRVHRTYTILHRPTFMKQYEQLWEPAPSGTELSPYASNCLGLCRQKGLDKTFPAMVNVVFALASLFGPNPPEQNSARAEAFFNVTQQIDLLDVIDEDGGIELVQLLLLMGYYLQTTEKFSKCWNIAGLAIRMAQNMGLQLSPNDARRKGCPTPSLTQREVEMRVRVWYGCVLLDREISALFGRTSMIRSDQLRLPLPEAIDDEYLSEDKAKRNSQPENCPSTVESFIETIKLYAILGQVLDRDESTDMARTPRPDALSSGHADAQSLLDLDTMIMEWRDSLPPHLQYDPTAEDGRSGNALIPDGFLAPALRLHVRFLHVRVLILRGALEHLLKQRHIFPPTQAKTSPGVGRVQDWMLSGIAAQCVLSAESLVRCLDTNIKTRSLAAWWYNVSYLHTCGSVLLMGQLCSFDEGLINRESLTASWDLCLRCLSQYTGLSSIANNSFNLLQQSTKRLLAERDRPGAADMENGRLQGRIWAAPNQTGVRPSNTPAGTGLDLQNRSLSATLVGGEPSTLTTTGQVKTSGVNLPEDSLEAELWGAGDPAGLGEWAFMPYLSQVAQLESLPQEFQGFDIFNIE